MCKYCDHDSTASCVARSADGYYCTRRPGHKGPHVACGDSHKIVMWDETGVRGRDGKWYPKKPKEESSAECLKQDIDRLPSDTRLAEEVVQAFHEEDQNVKSDSV